MGQKSGPVKEPAEQVVKEIRRATRRQFSAEEKIRIVLSGLRGEDSIAELRRREGIVQNLYYRWSKEFLEAERSRVSAGGKIPHEAAGQSGCAGVKNRQQIAFVGQWQGPGDEGRGALCSGSLCGSDWGAEPAGSGAALWDRPADGCEDAG